MIWMVGVAIALSFTKHLNDVNAEALGTVSPMARPLPGLSVIDYLIAAVYGTCLSLFVIAVRTKGFWRSPGKITLMIFAFICMLDWGLGYFAARMIIGCIQWEESSRGIFNGMAFMSPVSHSRFVSDSGHVFGVYYQNLPGTYGYVIGIPFLLFVLFRSREESWLWKFVWLGFLIFSSLMMLDYYGWKHKLFPWIGPYQRYYFTFALGLPMVAMTIAFVNGLIRKHNIDWWTIVTCTMLPALWLVLVGYALFAI